MSPHLSHSDRQRLVNGLSRHLVKAFLSWIGEQQEQGECLDLDMLIEIRSFVIAGFFAADLAHTIANRGRDDPEPEVALSVLLDAIREKVCMLSGFAEAQTQSVEPIH